MVCRFVLIYSSTRASNRFDIFGRSTTTTANSLDELQCLVSLTRMLFLFGSRASKGDTWRKERYLPRKLSEQQKKNLRSAYARCTNTCACSACDDGRPVKQNCPNSNGAITNIIISFEIMCFILYLPMVALLAAKNVRAV